MAWSWVDNFEAYSLGALNGQGSWVDVSGSHNDITVQNSVVYEGTKACSLTAGASDTSAQITITDETDDNSIVYFAIRSNDLVDASNFFIRFRDNSSDTVMSIYMNATDGKIQSRNSSGTYYDIVASYTVDTWYHMAVEFDFTNDQYRTSSDGGGSFGSWRSFGASRSEVSNIWIQCNGSGGTATYYVDDFNNATGTDYTQDLDETLTLVSTYTLQGQKDVSDTITLVDTASRSLSRDLSEVVTLVDTIQNAVVYTETLDEVLTLVDDAETAITAKELSETLTLVDTVVRATQISLADVVTLVETQSAQKVFVREYNETITLAETFVFGYTKTLNEVVDLVESIENVKQYNRELDEVVTLVDAAVKTLERFLDESITLVDTLSSITVFGREFDETITLQERFQGLINGEDIAYFAKYSDQAGTYIRKYFEIP